MGLVESFSAADCTAVPASGSSETEITCSAGQEIVYTAWPHRPLNSPGLSGRLGIVYCVNRACALHCTSLSSGCAPASQVGNL